jgi:FkbM family methyltransferase
MNFPFDTLIAAARPFQFRGKGRVLSALVRHRGVRGARVFGCRMELDLADLIQRHIYFGTYECAETALVKKMLRPGSVFIDAGANVGYYTALAASRVETSGTVLSFEPSPYAYGRLQALVQSNNLSMVRTFPVGLADSEGEVNLYVPPPAYWPNHSPSMHPDPNIEPIRVKVWTLDRVLEELGIDRVDLIKIDVEGYEPRVLRGAARALANHRIDAILCEFSDACLKASDTSAEELWQMCNDAGFAIDSRLNSDRCSSPGFHGNVLLVRNSR